MKAVEVPWSSDSAPRFGATFFLPSVGGSRVQFRVSAGLPTVPLQGSERLGPPDLTAGQGCVPILSTEETDQSRCASQVR